MKSQDSNKTFSSVYVIHYTCFEKFCQNSIFLIGIEHRISFCLRPDLNWTFDVKRSETRCTNQGSARHGTNVLKCTRVDGLVWVSVRKNLQDGGVVEISPLSHVRTKEDSGGLKRFTSDGKWRKSSQLIKCLFNQRKV